MTVIRVLFFFGLILLNSYVNSQLPIRPYQPINFQNINYNWKDVIFDSTLISDSTDGINIFSSIPTLTSSIIKEGSLYETYNVYNGKDGNIGFRLINRDLSNGTQIWKYDSYSDSIFLNEFPFYMFKDEDFLHIYSYLKPKNYNYVLPFFTSTITNCSVVYRKIQALTGDVVESNFLSIEDDNSIRVTASQSKGKNYGELVFFERRRELIYWERNTLNPLINKQIIHFQKLLPNGIKIGLRDSVEIGKYTTVINLCKWSDDTLVYFEFNEGDNFLKLLFYNSDFQLIGEKSWQNLPFPLMKESYIISEGPNFSIYSVFHGGAFKTIKQHTLCNKKGNIIDYVELVDDLLVGDEYFSLSLHKRERILIYKSKYEENPLKPITYFYNTNDSGRLGDNFLQCVSIDSLRHAWPRQISEIGNDQILVNFIESAIYREPGKTLYSHDYNARAQSLILFEASDLGLGTVSTKEEKNDWAQFRLFPNPATDKIEVRVNQSLTCQLKVRDFLGRVVISESMFDQEIEELTIQDLTPGIYFLAFEKEGKIMEFRKFVKI